ncbi:MAG: hypothetical protein ABIW38_07690 [Ferruginibacter sp.]
MKYSKWIGIITALILIIACFMPWTYHADVNKTFTGFFSEQDMYGKPGKFLVIFSVLSMLLLLINKVWAKRVHIILAAIILSYTFKTYVLFTSCYNAYCPEKKPGIYLVLIASIIILIVALFPDDIMKSKKKSAIR